MRYHSLPNKAIIAAAGSGKTTAIVKQALAVPASEEVLLTTFTNNNTNEIVERVEGAHGFLPSNITVMPWLTFLLRHGARPYQSSILSINEVAGLHFESREKEFAKLGWRPRIDNPRPYYLAAGRIYRDVLADFVIACNNKTNGKVIRRLSGIFQHIFLDEVQDVSGRDFDVIASILDSPIHFTMVGDPRQCTYLTTQSRTNQRNTKSGLVQWISDLERQSKLTVEHHDYSQRCVQSICDFADDLYPDLKRTRSLRTYAAVPSKGLHLVRSRDVREYLRRLSPQVLVWDKRGNSYSQAARNFGATKGLTYERVLISPTGPIGDYIKKKKQLTDQARAKLYVAVTRAKYSVGIVLDAAGNSQIPYWSPDDEPGRD